MSAETLRFAVAQLGARRHYAVPRILECAGMLDHFFTDVSADKGPLNACRLIPRCLQSTSMKRLLGRSVEGVSVEKVTSFSAFGFAYARRRSRARSSSETTKTYLWAGRTFCHRVIRHGIGGANGVYTFNSAGLELLRFARNEGVRTVMEQTIAPKEVEAELLRREHESFPDWESPLEDDPFLRQMIEREKAEWHEADLILCGSEFVRAGVISSGGLAAKCAVVPYGVDTSFTTPVHILHGGPLRVLTVGAIGLRKGSPYVLHAAKELVGLAEFRMLGPVRLKPTALKELTRHVQVLGPVPRTEVAEHYAWADVFLLPSICEGSAMVVYEALSSGLPVITTPNAGTVVRDGVDGFVVPPSDPDALVDRLRRMIGDRTVVREMGEQAEMTGNQFSFRTYQQELTKTLRSALLKQVERGEVARPA